MIDILRDPLWQFIGALLALLTLLAAFWIYLLQRPRKELAYGVLSSRRLLSLSSELRGRVEVTLDGMPVKDVHLLLVGIKNSGNAPILESEFLYAPTIRAGQDTSFISVELSKVAPSNLQPHLTLHPDRLEFKPLLLNPGDYFSVQVLTSGGSPKVSPDFRIVGTSKIEPLLKSRPFSDRGDWGSLLFWLAFLIFMIFIGTKMDTEIKKSIYIGGPSAIMLFVLYRWARSRFGAEASRYVNDV